MQWPHMNMNYPSLKQHTSKPFPQRIEKLWHNQICPGTVISNHLPHPEASSPHDPTPSSATPWIDHVRLHTLYSREIPGPIVSIPELHDWPIAQTQL